MDSGEHLGEIDTFQGGRLEIERQPPESEKCCFEKKRNMVYGKNQINSSQCKQYFPLSPELDLWSSSPALNIQIELVAPNCVLSTGSREEPNTWSILPGKIRSF